MLFLPLAPHETINLGAHGEHGDAEKVGYGLYGLCIPASPTVAIEVMMMHNNDKFLERLVKMKGQDCDVK